MSAAALTERSRRLFLDPPSGLGSAGIRRPLRRSDGGGLTLEQRLDRVWEGLHAAGAAECPICRGQMASLSGADGIGAGCGDCGALLA